MKKYELLKSSIDDFCLSGPQTQACPSPLILKMTRLDSSITFQVLNSLDKN